jgi:uracil-DNA glycosylase
MARRPALSRGLDPAQTTLDGLDVGPASSVLQTWLPQSWSVAADWRPVIEAFLTSSAGQGLASFMASRLSAGAVIYPAQPLWALDLTALHQVRVVILGQDPYHGPGQAQGLAFSVPEGVPPPPSLRNILRERSRDLGEAAGSGLRSSLRPWAEQGVLLLNSVLTVEQGQPASHAGRGWEVLTNLLLRAVMERPQPAAFMAWGAAAQAQLAGLPDRHLLLSANHPSPLSALRPPRPFIGCGHFSAANAWLHAQGQPVISW